MPDAEREREDVGVAYEDSTGFRRLDYDAGQGDEGWGEDMARWMDTDSI